MRPTKSDAKFTIATNVADGKVQVVVNALDQDDEFLNFLDMQAVAVGPDLKPLPLVMRQAAPGRYVGSFESGGAGSYLVNVQPGPGMAPVTTGASVPFSDEYRVRQTNFSGLERLAEMKPEGGQAGNLTAPLERENMNELLEQNAYRSGLPKAMSMQDIWHWCLLLGAVCLFGDVFVRRVSVDYAFPFKKLASLMRPKEQAVDSQRKESLQRLRSKKTEVSGEMESVRAATRFEASEPLDAPSLDEIAGSQKSKARSDTTHGAPKIGAEPKQDGYTSRLLAAKKAAQQKKDSND